MDREGAAYTFSPRAGRRCPAGRMRGYCGPGAVASPLAAVMHFHELLPVAIRLAGAGVENAMILVLNDDLLAILAGLAGIFEIRPAGIEAERRAVGRNLAFIDP